MGKTNHKQPEALTLPRKLHERIARIAEEDGVVYAEALAKVVAHGLDALDKSPAYSVTAGEIAALPKRQRLVLDGLRAGLSVKELAASLEVSEVTIRTHIIRIRERLGCPDLLKLRMP